jgi:hypothetical protein
MVSVTKRTVHVLRVAWMISNDPFVWNALRVNMEMNVKTTVQILAQIAKKPGHCYECSEYFDGMMCDFCKTGFYGSYCEQKCSSGCKGLPAIKILANVAMGARMNTLEINVVLKAITVYIAKITHLVVNVNLGSLAKPVIRHAAIFVSTMSVKFILVFAQMDV